MDKPLNIIWAGNVLFRPALEDMGHNVVQLPRKKGEVLDYGQLVDRAGFEPDLLFYSDVSTPPQFMGIESYPCATAFLAVDTHLHSWYPMWAQAFDFALVSLRDHMKRFELGLDTRRLAWMPPMPREADQPDPGAEKEWDLLFAGTVNADRSPQRSIFLEKLAQRVPGLIIKSGQFAKLFPRARLALNIAERGDLNYRVFEALACGACLVTPMVGHGMTELFTPGKHLFTYDPDDMDGLVSLVEELLADPDRREDVARAGNMEIEARHRIRHRAAQLMELMAPWDLKELASSRRARAADIHKKFLKPIYLHWAEAMRDSELSAVYLKAALDAPK